MRIFNLATNLQKHLQIVLQYINQFLNQKYRFTDGILGLLSDSQINIFLLNKHVLLTKHDKIAALTSTLKSLLFCYSKSVTLISIKSVMQLKIFICQLTAF